MRHAQLAPPPIRSVTRDRQRRGIAAWARLREHDRATWTDWLDVARALAVGRTAALKAADTNRCVGSRYNAAMGIWLRENGLDGVNNQERYRALLILENLAEIETWRAGLDEGQRRRWNHPNAVWSHWRRRQQDSSRSAPALRNFVKAAMPSHKNGKPVHWPQHVMRRAAMALKECGSGDIFIAARAVLEAAVRSENDLIELLSPDTAAMSALPRRTDVISSAGHVRQVPNSGRRSRLHQ
jgi:hypothetical protein